MTIWLTDIVVEAIVKAMKEMVTGITTITTSTTMIITATTSIKTVKVTEAIILNTCQFFHMGRGLGSHVIVIFGSV